MSSKPKTLTPRRFLVWLLLLLLVFCSPLLLSYRFLRQYGETLSPTTIVDRLAANRELYYRSAMHDDLRETALEMLRRRQPEVIALGSSLPLYFREEFFTSPFVCAAGVMDSLSDGEAFVRRMQAVARPKVVLFVLDFWWFTDPEVRFRGTINSPEQSALLSTTKLRLPYKLLGKKQITVRQFLGRDAVSSGDAVTNPALGLMARMDNVGRRGDGSELNGIVFTPRAWEFYAPVRERFAKAGEFVMQPGRFGPDLKILPERMALLQRILKRLEDHGSRVVLVYPPMAPPIATAMEKSGQHGYYFELGKQLTGLGREAYDFHSPDTLGIPLAEFSDTHHAGNAAYMRLLVQIVRQRPDSALSPHVNLEQLVKWTELYRGTTVAIFEKDHITVPETDFLGLGVTKHRATTRPAQTVSPPARKTD